VRVSPIGVVSSLLEYLFAYEEEILTLEYLFKCLFFLFIIIKLAIGSQVAYIEISIVLILAATNIIREKYLNSIYVIMFEFILVTIAITVNPLFSVFYGILCYDLILKKYFIGVLLITIASIYFIDITFLPETLLIMGICTLLSYLNRNFREKSELLKTSYDKERKYRYELEQTKLKLMRSSEDAVHIAEIKERNRIARDIHDNIGHSIAGILIQLQAAGKLYSRDAEKSMDMLQKSITNLSEVLTIIKNTVYNIKPSEELGLSYIKSIIENFSFCPVEFVCTGNFNILEAIYIEIIVTNIKEALTNASKYSEATRMDISLTINDNYIRLYIKDNGKGCLSIKDSLGISGMRERVKSMGGSISINGEKGFLIVCIIPLNREVGEIFEGFNS
jgi:signal transduction histidine kinase